MLSKAEIMRRLGSLGIDAASLAADRKLFEVAARRVYQLIPIPWRWFVGRKRIERLLTSAANAALQSKSGVKGATRDDRVSSLPASDCTGPGAGAGQDQWISSEESVPDLVIAPSHKPNAETIHPERSANMIRSESRKGLLGDHFRVHLDEQGREIGRSRTQDRLFGGQVTRNFDQDGNLQSESEVQDTLLGGKRIVTRSPEGRVQTVSTRESPLFGEEHQVNRDSQGRVVSRTYQRKDWFGRPYLQTVPERRARDRKPDQEAHDGEADDLFEVLFKFGFWFAIIVLVLWLVAVALAIAVMLAPVWLGAVTLSVIAGYSLAPGVLARVPVDTLLEAPVLEQNRGKRVRLRLGADFFKRIVRFNPDVLRLIGVALFFGLAIAAWPLLTIPDVWMRVLLGVGVLAGTILGAMSGRRVLCWQLENLIFAGTEMDNPPRLIGPRVALGFSIPGLVILSSLWVLALVQPQALLDLAERRGLKLDTGPQTPISTVLHSPPEARAHGGSERAGEQTTALSEASTPPSKERGVSSGARSDEPGPSKSRAAPVIAAVPSESDERKAHVTHVASSRPARAAEPTAEAGTLPAITPSGSQTRLEMSSTAIALQTGFEAIAQEVRVQEFVRNRLAVEASHDVERLLLNYAERVTYWDHGEVGQDFIRKDKLAYFERWPVTREEVEGPINVTRSGDLWVATFKTRFRVENPARGAAVEGVQYGKYSIQASNGVFKVAGETGQVAERRTVPISSTPFAGVVTPSPGRDTPPGQGVIYPGSSRVDAAQMPSRLDGTYSASERLPNGVKMYSIRIQGNHFVLTTTQKYPWGAVAAVKESSTIQEIENDRVRIRIDDVTFASERAMIPKFFKDAQRKRIGGITCFLRVGENITDNESSVLFVKDVSRDDQSTIAPSFSPMAGSGSSSPASPGPAGTLEDAAALFARGEELRNAHPGDSDLEAFQLFSRAADLGHPIAMHRLGVMYALGRGVAKDAERAVEWYRASAETGCAEAQYDLGVRCILGNGVAKDVEKGIEWYRKSARQGYPDAIEALKRRRLEP